MSHYSSLITINPEVRCGRPCIRGMRITVFDVLGWLASGMTQSDIIDEHPDLTIQDIKAALEYAADREHKLKIA